MASTMEGESTPVGIRTPNLLIRSQTLYPVELQAHFARQSMAEHWGVKRPTEDFMKQDLT